MNNKEDSGSATVPNTTNHAVNASRCERTRALARRLVGWRSVVDGCVAALEGIGAAETAASVAYQRMVDVLGAACASTEQQGQAHHAEGMRALVACCQAEAAAHSHVGTYLQQPRLSRSLEEARHAVNTTLQTVAVMMDKYEPLLDELRKAALRLTDEHGRVSTAYNTRLARDTARTDEQQQQQGHSTVDPVLTEVKLRDVLRTIAAVENDYTATMAGVNDEVLRIDDQLAALFKTVWFDISDRKLKQLFFSSDAFQTLQNITEGMDAASDPARSAYVDTQLWDNSTRQSHLIEYPFKALDYATLQRVDVVCRRNQPIPLGRKWKEVALVLTKTGYLHCFQLKDIKHSTATSTASTSSISGTEETGGATAAASPAPTATATAAATPVDLYAALTAVDISAGTHSLDEVIGKLQDMLDSFTPIWSMFLRTAYVNIPNTTDPGDKFSFDVVLPPSKKDWFGREVRYSLKAFTEVSLAAWAALIQDTSRDLLGKRPHGSGSIVSISRSTSDLSSPSLSSSSSSSVAQEEQPLSLVTSQAQADAAGQGDDVSVTSPSTAQLTPTTPKMLEAANSTAAKQSKPPAGKKPLMQLGSALVTKLRESTRATAEQQQTTDEQTSAAAMGRGQSPSRVMPASAVPIAVLASPTGSVSSSENSSPIGSLTSSNVQAVAKSVATESTSSDAVSSPQQPFALDDVQQQQQQQQQSQADESPLSPNTADQQQTTRLDRASSSASATAMSFKGRPLPPRPNRPAPKPNKEISVFVDLSSAGSTGSDDAFASKRVSLLSSLWSSTDILAEDPRDAVARLLDLGASESATTAMAEDRYSSVSSAVDLSPLPNRPRVNTILSPALLFP